MHRRLNILFIAASEQNVFPILHELHNSGLEPVWKWVKTAESLRRLLITHSWDAIITEYELPGFDAFAALSVVGQSQLDIPFIVISNAGGERLAVEMLKAGAHDYLMQGNLTLLPDILQTEVNAATVRLSNRQNRSTQRETEENYQGLYKNTMEGIYQRSPAGHYLMANMALARMYGYASPEAMISGLNDVRHQLYVEPQRREVFEQTIAQQGYVVGFESEVYCQDGTTLWISENGWVVCDDQGRPGYYQGFVTDISDRKRIEAIYQRGETRATTAFEQAAVGFSECNVKTGQITLVNPYFCKMMGYTQTELLEMTINDITHPDDVAESIQKLHQLSLGQTKSFKLEKRYCRKDGTIFWAEITICLVRPQTDQDAYSLAIIQDISDRKKAKQERERFFVLSRDLLCVASLEGQFIEVNLAWKNTLGYTQNELIGIPFINFVHPDDRPTTLDKLHRFKESNNILDLDFENRYRCKDGSYKWLSWRSIPDTEAGVIYAIARDVTHLKQEQQQLQHLNRVLEGKVEERTKALRMTQSAVDLAADCVFLIRANGSFHYVNNTARDKLGYSQEEFSTMKLWDINPTIVPDKWKEIWQIIKHHPGFPVESQHRAKNGNTYPVEINTKYLNLDGDEYCFSFVRDIGERKLAEAIIQKENMFRQKILENMAEGLCVCHQIDEFPFIHHTVWNREMQAITGYSLNEINNVGVIPGLVPDSIEQEAYVVGYMEQLRTEKNPTVKEAVIVRKDGQRRTISILTSVLPDAEGLFTVLSLIQDITERKQSQQNARLLVNVVESNNDAIITKNLQGMITSWNSAAVRLFGYTEAEAIGQSVTILFPPDRLDIQPQLLKRLRQGERIKNFETINLHKNGTPIQVSATISPLRDETGCVVGASKIVRDITQRKQAEMQLRLTNEELVRATRLKDEFLANMSHELRTPLNAILGMAESLQEEVFGKIHEHQIKPLQMIRRSGNHLLELINDILDVAKIESGQMDLNLETTAVIPLCNFALDLIKHEADTKYIQVETQFPAHISDVKLDEQRIQQLLINLLSNAVKFTPEGGRVKLGVSLHRRKSKHVLRIVVKDTGIGIAAKHMGQLFEPFIQIDSALNRKYSGTGLGLTLVKRIVELHGGTVDVSSQVGKGSCFTVNLPCTVVPSFPPAQPPSTCLTPNPIQAKPVGAFLILLADDKEASSITLTSYLRAKGYAIRLVTSAQEMLTLSRAHSPDLMLVDSQLSGTNSLDVVQQLCFEPTLTHTPMIVLTSAAMKNEHTHCHSVETCRYLIKPFTLKQLVDTVQQFLQRPPT